MKLFLLLALILLSGVIGAQPITPKGTAFDAIVKAYLEGDVTAVSDAYPAFQKQYPGNAYTKFFNAYINDKTGKDIEGALREYSEVIRMAPELSDPYIYRAKIFSNKGFDERAIADVTKAIDLEGKDAPAYFYARRGEYYSFAKNHGAALEDFKMAIDKSPTTAKYYRGLVNSAIPNGTPEQAGKILKESIIGDQKANAEIRFVYGEFLMRQKQMAEADKIFSAVISDKSFIPSADDLNAAAIAALNVKDFTRAITLTERAIELSPKNVDLVNNRATIALQQEKWQEVYAWAQKSLALNANSPAANMLMAVGIKRTGRGDALAAEYQAKAKKLEAEGN